MSGLRLHGGRGGGSGGNYLSDDFSGASLASWWVTALGTLATSGGALQASVIASDEYNMITNGEFTVNTTGWTPSSTTTLTRKDFASSPDIDPTGGTDEYGLEVKIDGGSNRTASQAPTFVAGAQYYFRAFLYSPSSNTQTNAAQLYLPTGQWLTGRAVPTTVEDTWQEKSTVSVASSSPFVYLMTLGSTANDVGYFDGVLCYHQSGIGYGNLYTPNAVVSATVVSPASAVTPRAILLRVNDKLNYVRLLVLPNTAGNDCILQTVTAGVVADVVGGAADVDWTAGQADEVRVFVSGEDYVVEYKKYGETTWTQAISTTSSSFSTQTYFGVQVFSASDPSFAGIDIHAL